MKQQTEKQTYSENEVFEDQEFLTDEHKQVLSTSLLSMVKIEDMSIRSRISSIKISNEEQYAQACDLATDNNRVLKRIEEERKCITTPLNESIKRINGLFKSIAERFQSNDEKIRKALLAYTNSRKKTDEIKVVNTSTGQVQIKELWDYEIVDASLLPREYLVPDEHKIGRLVRTGTLKPDAIPGVKIFQRKITSFSR